MQHEIRAEMAANVWKVLVSVGDVIAEGQDLVILESMKMEIPVQSDYPGKITSVDVQEGQGIVEEALIATVESS